MTPRERNIFLTLIDFSHQRLARETGYSRQNINSVLNDKRDFPEIRKAIARRFGLTEEEFFGNDHRWATKAGVHVLTRASGAAEASQDCANE